MRKIVYILGIAGLLLSMQVRGLTYIQTAKTQAALTPQTALKKLEDGNERFLKGKMRNRSYYIQTKLTAKKGQAPFAVVLSCMDSRGSPEIIFDQGIGDIFSLRVAGNVLNTDNIASIEYATEISKAKIILIMGHTKCGAVEAACDNVEMGNITELLAKIKPAVTKIKKASRGPCSSELVNDIAKQNVLNIIQNLPHQSKIVTQLLAERKVIIVGAIHNLATGKVTFFDEKDRTF